MRRLTMVLMTLGTLGLGGCQSSDDVGVYRTSKPLDKMTTEEWCAFYAKYLKVPSLAPKTRQEDMERMRARGCPMQG